MRVDCQLRSVQFFSFFVAWIVKETITYAFMVYRLCFLTITIPNKGVWPSRKQNAGITVIHIIGHLQTFPEMIPFCNLHECLPHSSIIIVKVFQWHVSGFVLLLKCWDRLVQSKGYSPHSVISKGGATAGLFVRSLGQLCLVLSSEFFYGLQIKMHE